MNIEYNQVVIFWILMLEKFEYFVTTLYQGLREPPDHPRHQELHADAAEGGDSPPQPQHHAPRHQARQPPDQQRVSPQDCRLRTQSSESGGGGEAAIQSPGRERGNHTTTSGIYGITALHFLKRDNL